MSPTLNFVYYFTGFIGGGSDFTCVSVCILEIMSKVVKHACRLRRYKYTHDQLNTRHFNIIFWEFFEGGGAQNLSLPPGASYPRYTTAWITR